MTRIRTLAAALAYSLGFVAMVIGAPRAQLIQPAGGVEFYSAAFNSWKGPVTGQLALRVGDRVRTGADGSCRVVFDNLEGDRDTVDVAPNTLLEVPDVPENKERVSWIGMFSEAVGEIFCTITRRPPTAEGQPSPFNVRTPTVVAGVRGTQFTVRYSDPDDYTFFGVKEGVLKGLMYGGGLVGLISGDKSTAKAALKVFRYASHLANAEDFIVDNQAKANSTYNRSFGVAETWRGGTLIDGVLVDGSWWAKELPWSGPERTWENPMVVEAKKGYALLHLRDTGWFRLEEGGIFSCYRLGNALMGRLRKGKLSFERSDPNRLAIPGGPQHEVEIFMKKPNGGDLKVMDYTPKGGITRVTLNMAAGGRLPVVDVLEGEVKVLSIPDQE